MGLSLVVDADSGTRGVVPIEGSSVGRDFSWDKEPVSKDAEEEGTAAGGELICNGTPGRAGMTGRGAKKDFTEGWVDLLLVLLGKEGFRALLKGKVNLAFTWPLNVLALNGFGSSSSSSDGAWCTLICSSPSNKDSDGGSDDGNAEEDEDE